MNILLDVISSMIIGGIVLLMLVGFNSNLVQSACVQTLKVITQSNLTTVTNILETDFRKMGYGMFGTPDSAIAYADSNKIIFKGDFQNTGSVDTLIYSFNATVASGKKNPNTRVLYRTYIPKGSTPSTQPINLGITRFRLWYYRDRDTILTGNPIPATSGIKTIKVAINVESTEPYKETTMPYLKLNPGV